MSTFSVYQHKILNMFCKQREGEEMIDYVVVVVELVIIIFSYMLIFVLGSKIPVDSPV